MTRPDERRVSIRGVELATAEYPGDDPVLVWGHGLTSSRADEDESLVMDWPRLLGTRHVLRYDARGHGESASSPVGPRYGWDQLALDQLELTAELGIDRYVAGGASLGAATALHAAVAEPERILGLLLVIPPTAWATRAAQIALYAQMAELVDSVGVEPIIAGSAAMPPPDPFVGRAEWRERSARALRAADRTRLSTVLRGAAGADLPDPERLRTVSVPTRILAWSGDPGHPLSTAEALVDLMPHAELHVAGTWDDLTTWTGLALDFLDVLAP